MCAWRRIERVMWKDKVTNAIVLQIYFASAAVAVDSSHMTASSSISWSRFSPPSNFVNGHVSMLQTVNAAWCSVMFWHMLRKRAYTEKAAAPGLSLMPCVHCSTLKNVLFMFTYPQRFFCAVCYWTTQYNVCDFSRQYAVFRMESSTVHAYGSVRV